MIQSTQLNITPSITAQADHPISQKDISPHALKVLYRLHEAGFQAYLVGGCVRDLLLGIKPKDFDIATNALPEQVRELFRNCRLIGRRFRLAHVYFGREIIEVATFRATQTEEDADRSHSQHGMILRDNVYGTIEEDIWRRDFTVNALYYNIADASVVDYCQGVTDLRKGILRLIGNPLHRYREDPVRILRAIRFASKLGFQLDPQTAKPIPELHHLLKNVSPARLLEETFKLFLTGKSLSTYQMLHHYHLLQHLIPQTDHCLKASDNSFALSLVFHAFSNTDKRIAQGKSVTPAFIFAALLWVPLQNQIKLLRTKGEREGIAFEHAIGMVIKEQVRHLPIPRRITTIMREIWSLQSRLIHRSPKRSLRVLHHPRFRAAYDFLLLRNEAGEPLQALCDWWTELQTIDEERKDEMLRLLRGKT